MTNQGQIQIMSKSIECKSYSIRTVAVGIRGTTSLAQELLAGSGLNDVAGGAVATGARASLKKNYEEEINDIELN